MKSRWFLSLAAILGLALFSSLTVPVAAADPTIKLVLGGTGATPWAIGNIAPGNNGTITVTLSNTGSQDGAVTIWLSDIVNSEGANPESETGNTAEPGELGDYLILKVSGSNLSANFTMPAKIANFPQSAADTKQMYVNPLKAFSTLNLQWEWRLPPETGNDVQGDKLSFTINYALEEFPPLPSPFLVPPVAPKGTPDVGITNTGPSGIFTGFTESYTMAVTNTGAIVLNDVMVTAELPELLELLSYQSSIPAGTVTGKQISWSLGTLNIGETKEIVAILFGVKAGTVVSTVTVTTREGVTWTYSLTITVLSAPGVNMSLIDTNDPVAVGDEFGYNIQVTNQDGAEELHNLTITGLIPSQTVFVSATGAAEFTIVGQEVRFKPVAILKPGENIQYQIRVKATAAGVAVFIATMRCDEFGKPIVDQEVTTVYRSQPPVPSLPVPPPAPSLIPPSAPTPISPPAQAPSEIPKAMSVWLIPVILAVIGAAALVYYIFFILMRRRWDWRPYSILSGATNMPAQTAEQRTLYAINHQKRVVELASAIAREMNLSNKLVKMLLTFGIIHDPDAAKLPYRVAQTALQYHERLNGSGYPQKLAGDDILLEARILAVADTVETMEDTVKTMSSPAHYRPGVGLAKALGELKRNSSTLNDSEAVKAFIRLANRGKFGFQTRYS